MTNHPDHGGSHLPDVTVISPVFDDSQTLLGFVANRAHHAELGESVPARCLLYASLAEEGVVVTPTFLYRNGKARFRSIEQILTALLAHSIG